MPRTNPMIKDEAYFERLKQKEKERKEKIKLAEKQKGQKKLSKQQIRYRVIKRKEKRIEYDKNYHIKRNATLVSYHEREFDYLKFYAPIMNWASARYKILKSDLEIGFFFYNHPVFTKQEFTDICKLFSKKPNVLFNRFERKGYLISRDVSPTSDKYIVYRLSSELVTRLKHIYKSMQLEEVPRNFDLTQNSSKRSMLQTTLRKLQKEAEEAESGKATPEIIRFRNSEEEQ